ncbi:MAG TPA: hypothetical protein VIG49_06435 [Acetobacteraceae bacterium]
MTLSDLPKALLMTVVQQIAILLLPGANGDMDAATDAAMQTLMGYHPETEAEFRLAARSIACSLQALEALAQAVNPELPLLRVLRLRSGAVSLNREAEKADRRLEKLRQDRLTGVEPTPEPVPEPDPPVLVKTTALIEDNRKVASYAKAHGLTFTQALSQRQRDLRLAERQRKQAARGNQSSVPALA